MTKSSLPDNSNIIFYDGECGFCHHWVKFVLKRDKNCRFYYAPLQGSTIKECLTEKQINSLPDSIVVFSNEKVLLTKSAAASFILKELGCIGPILSGIIDIFPQKFNDYFYDLIAKYRHKIFKKPDNFCPLLSTEQEKFFLS